MTLGDRLGAWFLKNPLAWILFGLLVVAEYGNYTIGGDLNRVCELLGEDYNFHVSEPATAQEEIDTICLNHDPDR